MSIGRRSFVVAAATAAAIHPARVLSAQSQAEPAPRSAGRAGRLSHRGRPHLSQLGLYRAGAARGGRREPRIYPRKKRPAHAAKRADGDERGGAGAVRADGEGLARGDRPAQFDGRG